MATNDLNLCQFIGRLGADPEIRYTPGGDPVGNIRLAVGWKSKDKEGCEWVPVVFFGKLAEIVEKYLKKGSRIYVAGKFRTRKWQDRDGNDRYTTEVVADQMQMLDGRSEESSGWDEDRQSKPSGRNEPKGRTASPPDDLDDDIPF